jgi:molecular chaperone DnaK
MGRIVGIDLGTTYSCVAIFNEKKGIFEVLPNRNGSHTTPSVVGLNKGGEVIVGEAAKRQRALDPDNTVVEIKRHMGELGADGKPYAVRFANKDHSPEEISAYILRELKEAAERALGEPVTGAVITVPAYFEEPQRQATMRAGRLAGFDVKRIINEPTAAAVAYGHDQGEEDEDEDAPSRPLRLLIYDLGGGTFDVSVVEVEKGNVRVKSTHGDHYLGGVDFDRMVATWVGEQLRTRWGVDIEAMARAQGREGERARKALAKIAADAEGYKKELSSQESVTLSFPMLVPDPRSGEPIDVELDLSRTELEGLVNAKILDTLKSVDVALKDARLAAGDVDEVILVGGSTRMPIVKRMMTKHFGKEPRTDIHPDLCVAIGAAHEALKHVDVKEVPPEHRQVIEQKMADLGTFVDITGHSLGIEVKGELMSVIIPKQTLIPALVTQQYTTVRDEQTTVEISVHQGEHRQVQYNTQLRSFNLENLPKLPAGGVKIEVTFALDSNGILTVTARDTKTNQQREVRIEDSRLKPGGGPGVLLPNAGTGAARPSGGGGGGLGAATPAAPEVKPGKPSAPIPEKFKKLHDQATGLSTRLPFAQSQRLLAALETFDAALRSGEAQKIEDAGNALMDVFDVRP